MKTFVSGICIAAMLSLIGSVSAGEGSYSAQMWETDASRIKGTGDLTGTSEKLMRVTLDFRDKVALIQGDERNYRYLDVIPYDSVDSLKQSTVTNQVGRRTARLAPLYRDDAGEGTQIWIEVGYRYKGEPIVKQMYIEPEIHQRLLRDFEQKTGHKAVAYVEGLREPEDGQVFSGVTVYPGEGLSSLKRSRDWYSAAIMGSDSVVMVCREDKDFADLTIPYADILSIAYERSAEATAWPLTVHRQGGAVLG